MRKRRGVPEANVGGFLWKLGVPRLSLRAYQRENLSCKLEASDERPPCFQSPSQLLSDLAHQAQQLLHTCQYKLIKLINELIGSKEVLYGLNVARNKVVDRMTITFEDFYES